MNILLLGFGAFSFYAHFDEIVCIAHMKYEQEAKRTSTPNPNRKIVLMMAK